MTRNHRIIFLNACSLLSKHHPFQWYVLQNTFDVTFITETWLQTQSNLSVYGYVIERVDRADGYGGVAVGLEITSITYYLTYIPPRTHMEE
jgi:hypothetical protein